MMRNKIDLWEGIVLMKTEMRYIIWFFYMILAVVGYGIIITMPFLLIPIGIFSYFKYRNRF